MSNLIPIKLAEQAIAVLEADIDRLRSRYAEVIAENARLKAEVERLNTGIQPEGSNDAVGRAVNVLLEKDKENARLKAEVEELQRLLTAATFYNEGKQS
jgi:regulator of replication initiation timing